MKVTPQDEHHMDVLKCVMTSTAALPTKEAELLKQFIQQYYKQASLEDLLARKPADLYGAAMSHWKLLAHRKLGEAVVRVYNPQFEQHGWQSPHTIIEIVHDDMPFLMDSVRAELTRQGYPIYWMVYLGGISLKRGSDGAVIEVTECAVGSDAAIYIEINRQTDEQALQSLTDSVEHVLKDVRSAVEDWRVMVDKVNEISASFENLPKSISEYEHLEAKLFLDWLKDNNFTFLGYYHLKFGSERKDTVLEMCEKTGLGVLRDKTAGGVSYRFSEMPEEAHHILSDASPLIFIGKTSTVSTVHRSVFTDYISIKSFNKKGEVIGHHKFVGLYTSAAYNGDPQQIPLVRQKIEYILRRANVMSHSHDGRNFLDVLKSIPRDDLFQAAADELYRWARGILYLQERLQVRLFLRKDVLGGYYSCLVYVPREKFNSALRERIQRILHDSLNASHSYFFTHFSESVLARIHFILRAPRGKKPIEDNERVLELKISNAALTWREELTCALRECFGGEHYPSLHKKYHSAFPAGYREDFSAQLAAYDIQYMENLSENRTLEMSFYRPHHGDDNVLRFKIFQPKSAIPLSDVVPMLENLGLHVVSERPYAVTISADQVIWINDFCMIYGGKTSLEVESVKEIFQDAFYHVWNKNAENDGFNKLVLSAGLSWRQVSVLRAYAKYLWQVGFSFSQSYIERALYEHPNISKKLVEIFNARFDPKVGEKSSALVEDIKSAMERNLDAVSSLDQDRILRRLQAVILATTRTNFFQRTSDGAWKPCISLKFNPALVPELPLPAPMYEIFVYAPTVEGIHLRTSSIARGGLRWSDRREDFRTEVLGLMKAQRVKNSVIVPMGAKGGFYPKLPPQGREAILQNGIQCYQTFVRGLLDVTDNLIDNQVVPPENVVRYDGDDYYLVVAADKGTATFSDIANTISREYHFWLDDAFASGGSAGYDHKKMAITARGAWEAVKRHFRDLNFDCQTTDFTVVGIGDMSGDVFGNGMLLSEHICLIGAFNHLHIFVDPNPKASVSYAERKRLFNLPRSQWSDYNVTLISKGGGVFVRDAKSIPVSAEMKKVFGIEESTIEPNALIRVMMHSKTDLLWNGGIGTWVKASHERNPDVGDRNNDALRVNADALRFKVVGEGGNLGFTQLARVEYALHEGRINTDAIDNSAGVNCSDHEVNIKILLNEVVTSGEMTEKQRNALLVDMTEEVSELVLQSNRKQPDAITVALYQAVGSIDMHVHLMEDLEKVAGLVRSLEFLPSTEEIAQRKAAGKGLTRPEIAVLMAYTKIFLKETLLQSDLPEDPYVGQYLVSAFPAVLQKKYMPVMQKHRLRREIIATQLSNCLVNEVGIHFVQRLQDETGATVPDIIRGYVVAREVFDLLRIRNEMDNLGCSVNAVTQSKMIYEINRLMRRATRWFLRHRKQYPHMQETIAQFFPRMQDVFKTLPGVFDKIGLATIKTPLAQYTEGGVPKALAATIATFSGLFPALDMIDATMDKATDLQSFMHVYYQIGLTLDLEWFRDEINQNPVRNHWDALARAAFRDSLDSKQRDISLQIMAVSAKSIDDRLATWLSGNQLMIARWRQMIAELKASPTRDFTMYSVVLRELMDMGA